MAKKKSAGKPKPAPKKTPKPKGKPRKKPEIETIEDPKPAPAPAAAPTPAPSKVKSSASEIPSHAEADAALLDEIEELELKCNEAELELLSAKEAAKDAKKIYESRCLELRKKIRERRFDDNRPLLKNLDAPKKPTRADEIASRTPTKPVDTAVGWESTPTTKLHIDSIEKFPKKLAEQIETDYPTMGKLIELHRKGTAFGQGVRSIKGVGKATADRLIDALDKWQAEFVDGWGKPTADHQDFTGENAPKDVAGIPDRRPDTPEDVVPYDDTLPHGVVAEDLKHAWRALTIEELPLSKAIGHKLKKAGFLTTGGLEEAIASGVKLEEIENMSAGDIKKLKQVLTECEEHHNRLTTVRHRISTGQIKVEIVAGNEDAKYYFTQGADAAADPNLNMFRETTTFSPDQLCWWLAGYNSVKKEASKTEETK